MIKWKIGKNMQRKKKLKNRTYFKNTEKVKILNTKYEEKIFLKKE